MRASPSPHSTAHCSASRAVASDAEYSFSSCWQCAIDTCKGGCCRGGYMGVTGGYSDAEYSFSSCWQCAMVTCKGGDLSVKSRRP
eukprot:3833809-Pyramimonas_sp.AAC.2